MKLTIYKANHSRYHYWEEKMIIEVKGTGTSNDPIMLDSAYELPRSCVIKNHNNHIIIRDQALRDIKLTHCSNIILETSKINFLTFDNCSKSILKEIIIATKMSLKSSHDILTDGCNIYKIQLINSSKCELKNNNIVHLYEKSCEKNQYQSNFIKKFKTGGSKSSLFQHNKLSKNNIKNIKYNAKYIRREIFALKITLISLLAWIVSLILSSILLNRNVFLIYVFISIQFILFMPIFLFLGEKIAFLHFVKKLINTRNKIT